MILIFKLDHKVTFLEGWRTNEIIGKLISLGYDANELEHCLASCEFDYPFITDEIKNNRYEGYLYPDTYHIADGEIAFSIFNKMLSNFNKKIINTGFFERENSEELLIIASLIEREVQTPEDKKIVSGIIQNRLDAGMTLGIDASILYALGDWNAELNYDTLAIDSLYNTRKYAGLPPGPICNPSVDSINAALNPTGTDYYYYLTATDTGRTYFAKTLEEHNANRAKYIK